jgi:hypothetical protein
VGEAGAFVVRQGPLRKGRLTQPSGWRPPLWPLHWLLQLLLCMMRQMQSRRTCSSGSVCGTTQAQSTWVAAQCDDWLGEESAAKQLLCKRCLDRAAR